MGRVVLLGIACVLISSTVTEADNKNKNKNQPKNSQNNRAIQLQRQQVQRQIQVVKSQVGAAKKALDSAKKTIANATPKLRAAEGEVQAAARFVDGVKSDSRAAAENLRSLENQIEESLANDASFDRVKKALEQAKQGLGEAKTRVLESSGLQRKLKPIEDAGDTKTLTRLLDEALAASADYQAALDDVRQANVEYTRVRREALAKNPRWSSAAEGASEARIELAGAEASLRGKLIRRNNERSRLQKAQQVAKTAETTIKKGGSALKQLEATQKRLNSSNRNQNNRRKNGKKK